MFTKRNIDVKLKLKISCNETARSIYHSICLILSYDNKNGSYSYVTNYIMTRPKLYFSLIPQNTALFIHAGNRYWQRKLWKKNLKYWRCCKYNNIMHNRYWLVTRQYVPLRSIISYFIWKASSHRHISVPNLEYIPVRIWNCYRGNKRQEWICSEILVFALPINNRP